MPFHTTLGWVRPHFDATVRQPDAATPPSDLAYASSREYAFLMRAFLIVLDSVGIGAAPDAADYGDEGASTGPSATDVQVAEVGS